MSESNYFLLSEKLQNGIRDRLRWKELTLIQESTIPSIINGDNCVLIAPTAGGKTEAAFIPILDTIYREELKPISVIYVSPIRALLNNQEKRLQRLGQLVNVDSFKWHGEVSHSSKKKFSIEPAHIMATTPESLEVILMSQSYEHMALFSNVRFFVIDEIHYFAECYRGVQLASIIERIQTYSQYDIQRIGLSATIGNPQEILDWMSGSSKRQRKVINPSAARRNSKILVRFFNDFNEDIITNKIRPEIKDRKSLFFCNSRSAAEKISQMLNAVNVKTKVHHSSVSKDIREYSEEMLKLSDEMCMCCTSTMELGIDVGDLDVVLQYNSPSTVASFRQRMGRTGRRPGTQSHYEFCTGNEFALLNSIAIVELARRKWVESANIPKKAYNVLLQQIFSTINQMYCVSKEYILSIVRNVNSFRDITDIEFDEFLKYLIKDQIIEDSGKELIIGNKIDKRFGSYGILEFISVFDTASEFSIHFKNKEVGTLQSWFVNILSKDNANFTFTLAGKTWRVDNIDFDKHILYVSETSKAKDTTWIGGGAAISFEIAQEMLKILNSTENYAYIDSDAVSVLRSMRVEHSSFGMNFGQIIIDRIKNGFQIYTYAGNKVNFTIGLLLKNRFGLEFNSNYFSLKVTREDIQIKASDIIEYVQQLCNQLDFVEKNIRDALTTSGYESGAKFFEYLPRFAQVELLVSELVDIPNFYVLLRNAEIDITDLYV
ncbi:DEAD/DEAH box helicase [Ruminiclostridium cellobioparum]|uniref:DEAD/DEAH box helicase n=1 Tax=Ruminiclostridium cellobioparum TaxID=29355 RepID=UPI0028B08359|nr:DEAD/DEAH box helicase [Ruminiclostridium cellobioparum]